MKKIKNNNYFKILLSFVMLTLGSFLAALALETFLIPNSILDPFVYVGYKNLGKRFLARTVYSMILFSIFLEVFKGLEPFTEVMLLATVYGGLILGVGVGLIIHFGGCVDGTESVSIVISKNTSLSVGQVVLLFNLIIYTVAGFIFGFDRAMYSLLTYFITFKVIDFVSEGMEQAKAALID